MFLVDYFVPHKIHLKCHQWSHVHGRKFEPKDQQESYYLTFCCKS